MSLTVQLPVVPAAPSRPTNPHFNRLGGEAAVRRLVEAFYAQMDSRADARTIRAMHPADLSHVKQVLVRYLSEWLGGPKLYSPDRGPPKLGRVHRPFAIGPAERDAWLACMQAALEETCPDGALRQELLAAFAKVASHLTNLTSHTSHPPQGVS